jgi:Peptidase family M1 domain
VRLMRLRWSKACRILLAIAALAAGLLASEGPEKSDALDLHRQLQNARMDSSQVYFVRDVHLSRNGLNLYLNRGFIGFLAPVAGRVTGAAFTGDGEILLIPPNPVERRNLAQFIRSAVLEEHFTTAYFRFSDDTAAELLAKAEKPDPDNPEQPAGLVEQWEFATPSLNAEFSGRVLEDMIGDPNRPFFYARLEGGNLGTFAASDDERAPEAIHVGSVRENEGKIYADVWCAFPSPRSKQRKEALKEGSARVISYKIETRIREDNSLQGRAELELESLSSQDRIVSFELARTLHVRSIEDENGLALPMLSEAFPGTVAQGERNVDWVSVVLNPPRPSGSRYRLTFSYEGNVITDVGNGVLYVGARSSWYPNRGSRPHADYDLTFYYPERLTLIATGKLVGSGTADGLKHSHWISDGPFPVAGFNLGAYHSHTRKVGEVTVEVYATREVEAALEKRYVQAMSPRLVETAPMPEGRGMIRVVPAAPPRMPDPAALLDQVLSRAADAIGYFKEIFGPFPFPRLALAQVPGDFGQGWPELVYLPTLSFLSGNERSELRQQPSTEDMGIGLFVSHEIAHQWWGNEVGWDSYHDQWLSEGFATYAAALTLEREKDGGRKLQDLLRTYKQDLLSKNEGGATVESGGPIWLGRRLTSSQNPRGYDSIVYKKSCWVLHMLRDLMTDPKTGSDKRFFEMLRDFVTTFRGRNPSTEDFLDHASRYMTPIMDLDRNHRLDWFFTAWVYGTGIPEYKLEVKTRALAANRYQIRGTIKQSGVPETFETLVPVVETTGRGGRVLLGRVHVFGEEGSFRFTTSHKPAHIAIDTTNLLAVVH